MMTFEEFQKTGRDVIDLNLEGLSIEFNECKPTPGRLYEGNLYIEKGAPGRPQWYLIIANMEYEGDNLEPLERKLYEYGVAELIFVNDGTLEDQGLSAHEM